MNISTNWFRIQLLMTGFVIAMARSSSEIYTPEEPELVVLEQYSTFEEKTALKEAVEQLILSLLSVPEMPKEAKQIAKRSAPNFLLGIHNSLEKKKRGDSEDARFLGDDIEGIDGSGVIVTFTAQPHRGREEVPDEIQRMWFDVSALPTDHAISIKSGVLRFFRKHITSPNPAERYTIKVYLSILDELGNEDGRLIGSIQTSSSGWMSLNVSECLQFWMQNPTENRGLYVTVTPVDASEEVLPQNVGIVGLDGADEEQPFIVALYENTEKNNIQFHVTDILRRLPRSTSDNPRGIFEKPQSGGQSSSTCGLKSLYVNFTDMGWQDWIVAPPGLDVSYCTGECNFPLSNAENPTAHAVVQTLVHTKFPDKIPKACCAPLKFGSLSVIYLQDDKSTILKTYNNILVEQCGCL